MELNVERFGNVAVVTVDADNLDAGNARQFREKLTQALEKESKVAMDFQRLRFVDSSGLGALLSCLRQLHARGGDLRLFGMTRPVRSLFELVRMYRVFEIFNTREEAVRSFG